MKKKNYYWSFMIAVIMAVISVGFVSCGDDDDDDSVSNKAIGKAPADVVAVDLGLPSGTKWANMNVGAEKPEDYGLYFAWGETTGYAAGTSHSFDWDSYKWYNGSINTETKYSDTVDNKTILDPEDDAAHFNWGGLWYMPTGEDVRELKKTPPQSGQPSTVFMGANLPVKWRDIQTSLSSCPLLDILEVRVSMIKVHRDTFGRLLYRRTKMLHSLSLVYVSIGRMIMLEHSTGLASWA